MRSHGRMTQAAIDHLPEVVEATKNFTGAELAGLVRSAASFSLAKNIDAKEVPIVVVN
jgi:SpoVK/Ycf46/Vps4 family AAA+-type ATPase